MDKVTKQGAYRARCVFDSFVAGRMQDGDIQGPGDLLGWDDLAADDQDTVHRTDNSVSAQQKWK